jgi:creatinine amidohydrolase
MYLVKMRPEQIQDAVQRSVPALAAAGVVEYHGPHLPVGTDYLIASSLCEEIEKRVECVLLPPFSFGPTLTWAGSAAEGNLDFDPEALFCYAREVFRWIASMGFRRIYVLQHHQGPEGLQSLCLRRAAAEVVRETTSTWGDGWGRLPEADLPHPQVFSWFQIAYLDTFSEYPSPQAERVPVGHGGRGETQLIQASHLDTVRMEALESMPLLPPWLEDACQADPAEGRRWIEFCVQGWVKELSKH